MLAALSSLVTWPIIVIICLLHTCDAELAGDEVQQHLVRAPAVTSL
jgi:hypothetical protein